jgi:glycosyltransferase involved in cell wall biosynthesis
MRVCYVVQRYGMQIAGGAEQHCREMAERLAQRGHEVEVATTCAQSYVDWANEYPAGTSELNGVTVHRFPVVRPRDNPLFSEYNRRVTMGRGARPRYLQEEWMRMQGPWAPELPRWLLRSRERFDAVICFTYLYWTTWAALDTMAGMVPLILHPTVHDEPPLRLSLYDQMFRRPDAFALSTPEEVELIRRRFHVDPAGDVIGIGVELPEALDPAPFLEQYGLRDTPYLLYLGRLDEGKGAGQLMKFFVEYKRRHPRDDLKLVMCGEALIDVPERDDIIATGFVDYETRDRALGGMFAFALPSFFESFSMVLTEAFAHRRPALVQGWSPVLRGHAQRSRAAVAYDGYAEFEVALEALRDDPALADAMGAAGRAYVEREYTWDVVMDRYERLIEQTVALVRAP